jgi:hypothetical protein
MEEKEIKKLELEASYPTVEDQIETLEMVEEFLKKKLEKVQIKLLKLRQ